MAKILTEIKPGVNVPESPTQVVAFNKHGDALVGTLHKCPDDSYRCSTEFEGLHDITQYITLENLQR